MPGRVRCDAFLAVTHPTATSSCISACLARMGHDVADPRSLTAAYIDKHRISELFQVWCVFGCSISRYATQKGQGSPPCPSFTARLQLILSELLIQKPAKPLLFINSYLERVKTKGACHFCNEDDLVTMFGLFDASRNGSISAGASKHACHRAGAPGRRAGNFMDVAFFHCRASGWSPQSHDWPALLCTWQRPQCQAQQAGVCGLHAAAAFRKSAQLTVTEFRPVRARACRLGMCPSTLDWSKTS